MAFLRCLQTVSSAGGRKVRANTDGPREVEKKEESEGEPARYRDEYRGEQSSTIELGVPRHAIPPSAYDPRAMTRMRMSLNIRIDVRLYACVANVLHFSLSIHTPAGREGALPFARSRSRGEVTRKMTGGEHQSDRHLSQTATASPFLSLSLFLSLLFPPPSLVTLDPRSWFSPSSGVSPQPPSFISLLA